MPRRLVLWGVVWALLTSFFLITQNRFFLVVEYRASQNDSAWFYVDDGGGYRDSASLRWKYLAQGTFSTARMRLPKKTIENIRLYPFNYPGYLEIDRIYIADGLGSNIREIDPRSLSPLRGVRKDDIPPGRGVRLSPEPAQAITSPSGNWWSGNFQVDFNCGRVPLAMSYVSKLTIALVVALYVWLFAFGLAAFRNRRDYWLGLHRSLPLTTWSVAVCALVMVGFITHVTFGILKPESFNEVFSDLAAGFLQGRIDLPAGSFDSESIDIDGRRTSYFGPWPAILRILLVPLVPLWRNAGSLPMIFAVAAYAAGAAWLTLQLHARMRAAMPVGAPSGPDAQLALCLVATLLGGSLLIVGGRGYVYHEALAWGVAGATIGAAAAVRFFGAPGKGALLIFTMAALVAAHSRVTSFAWLCAFVTVLGFVHLRQRRFERPALAAFAPMGGALVVIALTVLLWNHMRFGNALVFVPIERHYGHPVERLAHFGISTFAASNVPDRFWRYFVELPGLSDTFPYLEFNTSPLSYARDDIIEPYVNFLVANAGLVIVALIGLTAKAFYRGRSGLVTAAALSLVTLFPVLGFVGVTERYVAELIPSLVVFACVGIAAVAAHRVRSAVMAAACIVGCVAVALLGIRFQGELLWGIPSSFTDGYAFLADKSLLDAYANPLAKGVQLESAGLATFQQMNEFQPLRSHSLASRIEYAGKNFLVERNESTRYAVPLQPGNCFLLGNTWLGASRAISHDLPWYVYPYSLQARCAWNDADADSYLQTFMREPMQWVTRTIITPSDPDRYVSRFRESLDRLCQARNCERVSAAAAWNGPSEEERLKPSWFGLDCDAARGCTWYRYDRRAFLNGVLAGSIIRYGDYVFFAYTYEPLLFAYPRTPHAALEELAARHARFTAELDAVNRNH